MLQKGKKALLLMDNFSAHELAVEQMEEVGELKATKVIWLPPNSTSHYQPLDQGIIQNWKTHVHKQFVLFMAKTFDEGKNLTEEMHVLRAVRWGIQAWENDVQPATIQSCWRRSQALDFRQHPQPPPDLWTESEHEVDAIRQGLIRMKNEGFITTIPNIHEYISPYSGVWSERVDDEGELNDLVDDIVAHNTQQEVDLVEEEGQLIRELLPPVSHTEALLTLHTLRRYEEEYQCSTSELLKELRSFERELDRRNEDSKTQSYIDSYFTRGGQLGKSD